MIRENIKACEQYVGYYHHPTKEHLVLNVRGRVIDLNAQCCLIPYVSFYPYPVVKSAGKELLIHRLMAETFIHNDKPEEYTIVNHLDGNKNNYECDNLEWATHRVNIIHAYQNGLRDDNLRLEVKNILTDEVRRFYSLNETARAFEVNPYRISAYVNGPRTAPFDDIYSIVKDGEVHTITKDDAFKHRNGNSKDVVVESLNDGSFNIYQSVGHVSEVTGIKAGLIYSYLNNGTVRNIEKYGIRVWYRDRFKDALDDAVIVSRASRVITTPTRKPVPVEVKDLITKTVKVYESAQKFAELAGVTKSAIQKAIGGNDGRWRNFIIRYKTVNQSPLS